MRPGETFHDHHYWGNASQDRVWGFNITNWNKCARCGLRVRVCTKQENKMGAAYMVRFRGEKFNIGVPILPKCVY